MAAPPKFADLGKEARDLHSKNFHLDCLKLEAKTKSKDGFEFTAEGNHNTESGNTLAALETKFKYAPYGLTVTEKWNTGNVLSSTLSVENKLVSGLKIDLDTTLSPPTGKKTAKVKTAYKHGELMHVTGDFDFGEMSAPTVDATAVFAHKGFHAGYHVSYDTGSKALVNNNVSLTYKKSDLVLHASALLNSSTYVGSVHHNVNSKLSAAAVVSHSGSGSSIAVGGSYSLDDDTCIKAKLDNNLSLGCSYVQKLKPGLQLTMSGLLNGKALDAGGHKVGLSLNFDA